MGFRLSGAVLVEIAGGLLIETAPAYFTILPQFYGAGGYVVAYAILSFAAGLMLAAAGLRSVTVAITIAVGKFLADILLGWRVGESFVAHVIAIVFYSAAGFLGAWLVTTVLHLDRGGDQRGSASTDSVVIGKD